VADGRKSVTALERTDRRIGTRHGYVRAADVAVCRTSGVTDERVVLFQLKTKVARGDASSTEESRAVQKKQRFVFFISILLLCTSENETKPTANQL
jgi:hypothetical protein